MLTCMHASHHAAAAQAGTSARMLHAAAACECLVASMCAAGLCVWLPAAAVHVEVHSVRWPAVVLRWPVHEALVQLQCK